MALPDEGVGDRDPWRSRGVRRRPEQRVEGAGRAEGAPDARRNGVLGPLGGHPAASAHDAEARPAERDEGGRAHLPRRDARGRSANRVRERTRRDHPCRAERDARSHRGVGPELRHVPAGVQRPAPAADRVGGTAGGPLLHRHAEAGPAVAGLLRPQAGAARHSACDTPAVPARSVVEHIRRTRGESTRNGVGAARRVGDAGRHPGAGHADPRVGRDGRRPPSFLHAVVADRPRGVRGTLGRFGVDGRHRAVGSGARAMAALERSDRPGTDSGGRSGVPGPTWVC